MSEHEPLDTGQPISAKPGSSSRFGAARKGRAVLWAAGLLAICLPHFAVPLPGGEWLYTAVVLSGFGLWLVWAILLLLGGVGGRLELAQGIAEVMLAALTMPKTGRIAEHLLGELEGPLVLLLYLQRLTKRLMG